MKKNNGDIRRMLSSVNDVLWEGAGHWTAKDLVRTENHDPLNKIYTNVCFVVHPDNHIGLPHHELAKAIFKELSDAMTRYNESRIPFVKDLRLVLFL